MIPSIEYLRGHDPYRIVPDLGDHLGRAGRVGRAVLPHAAVRRSGPIAADTSSRTSNALLRILCVERFGIDPEFVPMAPDADRDAASAATRR